MKLLSVRLRAPARALPELSRFYGEQAGFEVEARSGAVATTLGETRLELVADDGGPFYHFAVLVPGDRFDAALEWADARLDLLPDAERGDVVFDFAAWRARACYFHDPAGNIVELIAHRGIGETGRTGRFAAGELLGLSELGLVVADKRAAADALAHGVGLQAWDGSLEDDGGLAFVGERARTLILAPPGRPWLPTGRPAESHRVDAVVSGAPEGVVTLPESGSTVARAAAARR